MVTGFHARLLGVAAGALIATACANNTTTTPAPPAETPPGEQTPPVEEEPAAPEPEVPMTIKVVADQKGYTPSNIAIKRGAKATVEFTLSTEETCASGLVIPDLKIEKRLKLNAPFKVDIPTDKAHTFAFECSMAMYGGKIVVK